MAQPFGPTGAQPFPQDWASLLVLVPHPDDPEYGTAAAVAKWTAAGKTVRYALASSGEAGIAGMEPAQAGPLREEEQRRAAAIVGSWASTSGASRTATSAIRRSCAPRSPR